MFKRAQLGVLMWLFTLSVLTFTACGKRTIVQEHDGGGTRDGGADTIMPKTPSIHGRVVDFESCFGKYGCEAIGGMRVSLLHHPEIVSEVTSSAGAFHLDRLPIGLSFHLVVLDASGKKRYLPTIQGEARRVQDGSHDVEDIYAVARERSLYRGIQKELGVSIEAKGLYVGMVVEKHLAAMHPVSGVSVVTDSASIVRFYSTDLDVDPAGGKAFFPPSVQKTGLFGLFVAIFPPAFRDDTISVVSEDGETVLSSLGAPVGSGYVTFGLHFLSKAP